MAVMNAEMAEELSGVMAVGRREAKRMQALERELRGLREADPIAQDIVDIIEYWKHKLGHPRAKARLDDDRGKAVKKGLTVYSKIELYEMVDGLALAPFVKFGKRKMTGTDHQRYDSLEFALKSDDRVRECIEIAWRSGSAAVDALYDAWGRANAQERELYALLSSAPGFDAFVAGLAAETARKLAA